MNKRENVLSLYKRQGYEFAPVEFTLCPALVEEFKKRTGSKDNDVDEYFDFDIRKIGPLGYLKADNEVYLKYYDKTFKEGTNLDDYGVAHEPGSEKAMHLTLMHHPMENLTTIDEIKSYPYPKIVFDNASLQSEQVEEFHRRGYAVFGGYEATIWERSWYLRSMPELMCDMMTEDVKAVYLFDKITEDAIVQCNALAKAGVDILRIGDDIGMQTNIMMSVDLYVKWIKPRLKKVIDEVKSINSDILVQYHSCGYIIPFIDHLIEVGVDILNPIQPESMDFKDIYDKYGDRLSFNATIGTQTTMPFGTADEVYKTTQQNLSIAGEKGGLLCAPTHILEPEVPWENIIAYVKACREYKDK